MKNQRFFLASTLLAFVSTAQATEGGMHKASTLPFGMDPVHLHLLTNHAPIFVTFSGLVALLPAFFWKNDVAKRIGLLLLLMGTIGGLVTFWLGQQAYKPVRGLTDETGQDWLDLHMERAEQIMWLFWIAAISSAAALAMVWRNLRFSLVATIVAGLLGAAALGASGWIADAGGKIRHQEIRCDSKPPTYGESAEESEDHQNVH